MGQGGQVCGYQAGVTRPIVIVPSDSGRVPHAGPERRLRLVELSATPTLGPCTAARTRDKAEGFAVAPVARQTDDASCVSKTLSEGRYESRSSQERDGPASVGTS
jgi:hypothetical protein